MKRTLRVVIELEVRDPTQAELDENDFNIDEYEIDGDPTDWVSTMSPSELSESIGYALESENNPEMFAGSGIFVQTGNAKVKDIEWLV